MATSREGERHRDGMEKEKEIQSEGEKKRREREGKIIYTRR